MILGCIIIGIVLAYFLVERQKEADRQQHFQQSDYFAQTGNAYYDVKTNAGKRGEYFISELINPLIGYKRVLYNCYIPKANGETTEVDVILIHETGIYVI